MGQAKLRGSFEERKEAGQKKKREEDAKRLALEIRKAEIKRQWELEYPEEAAKRKKIQVLLGAAMTISYAHSLKAFKD